MIYYRLFYFNIFYLSIFKYPQCHKLDKTTSLILPLNTLHPNFQLKQLPTLTQLEDTPLDNNMPLTLLVDNHITQQDLNTQQLTN